MRGCGEVVPGDGPFTGESSLDSEHCTHYSVLFPPPPPHLSPPSPPPPPPPQPKSLAHPTPLPLNANDQLIRHYFRPRFFFFFFFGWFGSSRGSVTTGRHYDVVLCQDIVRGMAQRRSTSPRTPLPMDTRVAPTPGA